MSSEGEAEMTQSRCTVSHSNHHDNNIPSNTAVAPINIISQSQQPNCEPDNMRNVIIAKFRGSHDLSGKGTLSWLWMAIAEIGYLNALCVF